MQIDSHSQFVSGWDSFPVTDMKNTPSYPYSALTHYPPSVDWPNYDEPAHRICGAKFADSDIESQIVRLTVTARFEREFQTVPCRAPFIGAGYVFAHASFLAVMPFDPYVPWVFMGEEILFSLRLHTWGYDIYSPTHNTASHIYVREHKPKFWETVGRLFQQDGIHNDIQGYIINRPKYIIGYPESSSEQVDATLLAHTDVYGVGPKRPLAEYMAMVGLDPVAKEASRIDWCVKCEAPRPVTPFELPPQAVQ
ncbi:glycosyltransferase [Tribonema minus]|uniref:Glycosyltransferase n=1 Tax=Tribonema minus TaxID=303371 RepID=A0A835YK79_9STRA|nr:glycosyltransferase [Tribonema minus]